MCQRLVRRTGRGAKARRAFTLLEVTLAMSIGVVLLGALYVAVDTQLHYAQAGRDVVEQSTLARGLLVRMAEDISLSVGLSDPARFRMQQNSSQGGGGGGAGGSTGATTGSTSSTTSPSTSTTTSTASTTSSSSSNSSSTSNTTTSSSSQSSSINMSITFPLGIQGDNGSLVLYVSRVPHDLDVPVTADYQPLGSDLRRICYWLADDGKGLARQEMRMVTSTDAQQLLPPNIPDEDSYIIAPEVRSLEFQYFDGTNWYDSWDSTVLGDDGVTPVGSPRAIAITLTLARQAPPGQTGDGRVDTFRHVVSIDTANGATIQQTANGSTTVQQAQSTGGGS
jgi:prepilin-type N-terminal cleavage/methylation domain-containing protein